MTTTENITLRENETWQSWAERLAASISSWCPVRTQLREIAPQIRGATLTTYFDDRQSLHRTNITLANGEVFQLFNFSAPVGGDDGLDEYAPSLAALAGFFAAEQSGSGWWRSPNTAELILEQQTTQERANMNRLLKAAGFRWRQVPLVDEEVLYHDTPPTELTWVLFNADGHRTHIADALAATLLPRGAEWGNRTIYNCNDYGEAHDLPSLDEGKTIQLVDCRKCGAGAIIEKDV